MKRKDYKVCLLCQKPHKCKTQLCFKCNKARKDLDISISKLLMLKKLYQCNDVYSLLNEKPYLLNSKIDHNTSLLNKRNVKKYYDSYDYKNTSYKKWNSEIPLFISKEMEKYPTRKLMTISGDKQNPNIHYLCLSCNEEQICRLNDIDKGHDCSKYKSTGEILVETFLQESNIPYVTQFKTLKCYNPITQRQLPYDIELVGKKIVIEIQGEQHISYVEYFHGTIDNFQYQLRKDDYKKRWAISKGYKILYIYYDDFINDKYKTKIFEIINME